MPVLTIYIDEIRATRARLVELASSMDARMNILNERVYSMVGSQWIAQGADQWLGDYEVVQLNLRELLLTLERQAKKLDREVDAWVEVAETY